MSNSSHKIVSKLTEQGSQSLGRGSQSVGWEPEYFLPGRILSGLAWQPTGYPRRPTRYSRQSQRRHADDPLETAQRTLGDMLETYWSLSGVSPQSHPRLAKDCSKNLPESPGKFSGCILIDPVENHNGLSPVWRPQKSTKESPNTHWRLARAPPETAQKPCRDFGLYLRVVPRCISVSLSASLVSLWLVSAGSPLWLQWFSLLSSAGLREYSVHSLGRVWRLLFPEKLRFPVLDNIFLNKALAPIKASIKLKIFSNTSSLKVIKNDNLCFPKLSNHLITLDIKMALMLFLIYDKRCLHVFDAKYSFRFVLLLPTLLPALIFMTVTKI